MNKVIEGWEFYGDAPSCFLATRNGDRLASIGWMKDKRFCFEAPVELDIVVPLAVLEEAR